MRHKYYKDTVYTYLDSRGEWPQLCGECAEEFIAGLTEQQLSDIRIDIAYELEPCVEPLCNFCIKCHFLTQLGSDCVNFLSDIHEVIHSSRCSEDGR